MGHIVLRLDRVMADRKMSLNELSEKVGVANVNLSKMKNGCYPTVILREEVFCTGYGAIPKRELRRILFALRLGNKSRILCQFLFYLLFSLFS